MLCLKHKLCMTRFHNCFVWSKIQCWQFSAMAFCKRERSSFQQLIDTTKLHRLRTNSGFSVVSKFCKYGSICIRINNLDFWQHLLYVWLHVCICDRTENSCCQRQKKAYITGWDTRKIDGKMSETSTLGCNNGNERNW